MFPVLEFGMKVWACRLDSLGCTKSNHIARVFHLASWYLAP